MRLSKARAAFKPRGQVEIVSAQGNRVKIGDWRLGKSLHWLLGGTGGDEGRCSRGVEQPFGAQIVRVGVSRALSGKDANTASGTRALAGRFHNLLIDAEGGCRNRLKVEVGIVATGGKRFPQAALKQALREAEFLKKIAFLAGDRRRGRFGHDVLSLRRGED